MKKIRDDKNYTKILKRKLKANQIQVITCDNYLYFQKYFLFNNEKEIVVFSIVIWLLNMKSELFLFYLLREVDFNWGEWTHQKLKKTWQGEEQGVYFDQKLVDANCGQSLRTKLMSKYA